MNVDLGDIKETMECVNKRHHIIHRNGKDKDGKTIQIGIVDIEDVLEKTYNFISNIEKQISPDIEIEDIKSVKSTAIQIFYAMKNV